MYYADLSTKCQVDRGSRVRAIGWLSKDHAFTTGDVPQEFLATLRVHLAAAVQRVITAGPHFCELCANPSDKRKRVGGSRNLWIPTIDYVYVAPELILHYIEKHNYRPPDEFVIAVTACPPQDSLEYVVLLTRFPLVRVNE